MNSDQEADLIKSMQEAADRTPFQHVRAVNTSHYSNCKPNPWYIFKDWVYRHNPFNRYIYVSSPEEYIALPWAKRSVFRVWYLEGVVMGGRAIVGTKKERQKIRDFIQKNHPLQFVLREIGWKSKLKLSNWFDSVRFFLNPRQKWLTDQIPNSWCDKVELIPEVNFAMVVNFIEGEKALDVTDWEATSESASQFSKELRDCYQYIKVQRPALQADYERSFPDEDSPTYTGDYTKDYAENNRIEALIESLDTKWLVWIVTNRGYFWA